MDEDGNSPLHYLGENASCSAVMIEALLAAKANPNTQNQVSRSVSSSGFEARALADVSVPAQFQSSATHYLLQNSAVSLGMVLALLQHKADLNVKNNVCSRVLQFSSIFSGSHRC